MKAVSKEDLNDEIVLRVLRKQIALLYKNQKFAILITVALATLMFALLMPNVRWDQLQPWVWLIMVSVLIRMTFSWLYYRAESHRAINLKRAEIFYLVGIVSTAIVWSMFSIALFPIIDFGGQLILCLFLTGFASGAYTTMGYMRTPVCVFVIMLLVPLSFAIYWSDIPRAQDVAIAMLLYMLIIIRSAFLFYKNTYNMLVFHELSIDRENELLLQREKANSANLAKSEFLSRMSHELRTPLNAILGLSELQLRDKQLALIGKQSSRAQKIGEAGKHLLTIVNDVLDLSRIETGSMDIKLQKTDLYDVIQHSIALVETKASLRNIIISSKIVQSEISVMADSNRLKQIVVNLLDNAIKYNKQGGNVSIDANIIEQKRVRLNIVDTGYGLQSEEILELYVPFSRLGAESKGIDGTGIGLSLSKDLVELMGGSIGVNSRPGEGSCFWIELPYVTIGNTADVFSSLEKSHFQKLHAAKVLLVEDNLVNSEIAVDMLDAMGISADVAFDGEQAIELFKTNQYSLILMDCEMPVLDGYSATKQIRKIELELQQSPVPIIAITAHAISGTSEKCIASGMNDFLSKPFSMSELHTILIRWFDDVNTDVSLRSVSGVVEELEEAQVNDFICDATILDCDILLRLYLKQKKSNSNLMEKVVSIYIEQSSNLLCELDKAFNTSDLESIRMMSHTLKSSSVNVGALKFSELCREIELSSEKGIIEKSLIHQVASSYNDVERALKGVLYNNTESS